MVRVVPGVAAELAVFEDVAVEFVADFVEVVHVELPHEGAEVLVAEVDGQDFLFEAVHVHDGEVGALLIPAGDITICVVLHPYTPTSRISKVFEMKMEGPEAFSFLHRPLLSSSLHSIVEGLMFYFFYGRYIESSKLNLNSPPLHR